MEIICSWPKTVRNLFFLAIDYDDDDEKNVRWWKENERERNIDRFYLFLGAGMIALSNSCL